MVLRVGSGFSVTVALAVEIKNMNIGIPVGDEKICILLHADDIVSLGEREQDLQSMLDT